MFSAAELIHALQRRLQLISPHLRRAPGEFPPGWQAWFASMHERIGAVRGATAEAFIAVFLARPLAVPPPKSSGDLTRWQSFATLWRQDWHGDVKPDRVDRRVHWFATAFTVLWHVFFAAMLLYLMYLRFLAASAIPPQGEEVVMIEYVGKGTPKEPGGGPGEPGQQVQQQAQPRPQQQAAATPAEPTAEAAPTAQLTPPDVAAPAPAVDAPVPDVAQREVPEPQLPPPAPTVEQPVAVSEPTPSEPTVFVLPPTRRRPPEPAVAAPELRTATPTVRTAEVAEPVQPIRPNITPRDVAAPSIEQRQREVAVREVPVPVPSPTAPVRTLPTPALPTPEVRSTAPGIRTAEIPTPPTPAPASTAPAAPAAPAATAPSATAATAPPATGPATPASSAASTAPAAAAGTPGSTQARPAAPAGSGTQPVAGADAGPKPAPAPGTWSTPTRGDDWGESTRNRPGGQRGEQPGIYNSDGSVRIADAPGSAAPGQPPGAITEEIKDLDRAGTWLRRKPNDFEPTTFDKYWVPNESLLAEWVRRGVRKVAIPIPGTGKSIECVISMLALGGGCGISDPDLNDQPAGARPPPPVPFKPALQEDNGAVKPPGG
ncbi:hypothetical protein MNR01_01370 [Lysobacter sp. S4-A87]|uniref:hypothetical protein n=1 Tax=Lysobacter sp. S4-A87 TaxID=2925843 RepID=UPI001F536706|nr:hypothetical protein [Lysobacter sp. S4-A87]UNK51262.1 hypothetical protein MNR01_01370 [Lysobacter sp. S4-A87]